jgi:non-homologous end joining protein Ku
MVQKRLMTWRVTLRSRERVVITHYYRDALMATVLKHSDEILDQGASLSHRGLLPGPEEIDLMLAKEIVDRMIGNLNLSTYKDSYRG